LQRAQAELGQAAFAQKLAYMNWDPSRPLAEQFVTCLYQATSNSSSATEASAQELARELGTSYHRWNVQPAIDYYRQLTEEALGRELSWERDDLTLQNIQSRARVPALWMMANQRAALLLTTANRSEVALGYATMDGDTSGGLAPVGGLAKHELLEWLRWAEAALELPALRYVNQLTPTAELRPAQQDQSDEEDLMPYPILTAIENCAIRDYLSPLEAFQRLRGIAPDGQLKNYVHKFYTLWARTQWKRERYAPSFHLDDKNLDPRSWCRFPILNGSFKAELAELDQYVQQLAEAPSQR
jgi:NAD+ synthase (glutamine-hydrolysing)